MLVNANDFVARWMTGNPINFIFTYNNYIILFQTKFEKAMWGSGGVQVPQKKKNQRAHHTQKNNLETYFRQIPTYVFINQENIMEFGTYLVIKQVIFGLLLIVAFSLFTISVRNLIALMRNVKGSIPVPAPPCLPKAPTEKCGLCERIQTFFLDIMWQKNVRRKAGIGLAHMAIFFGFLCIQPHSIELMIRSVFPSFSFHGLFPTAYNAMMSFGDIMAVFCLAGFVYVLYRRLVLKPSYLPKSNDAFFIILFTTLIVITYLLLNALATVSTYAANGAVLTNLPISGFIATALQMGQWTTGTQNVVFEVLYWIHLLTILCFLVYVPSSKHLHLLAAIPNVLLKPTKVEKAIGKTDVENEDAETFGLGFINEITWKQCLDLFACTECGRCEEQCPASKTGKALSPRAFIHNLRTELFEQSKSIIQGKEGIPQIIREGGHVLAEEVWDCTSCRACEEVCPVNIQHLDFMFELRKHQVLMEASFPAELGDTFTNLENQSNPWGFPSASRGDWAKGLDVPHISECPDAEIVYFAGSALSLEDRGKKVSQALMSVLKTAGVKVAILGADEQDSGDDARRSGNEYLAQTIIQGNVETLNGYEVKHVLTACPHTYNMLKNEYPQFGCTMRVWHHTEYLDHLLSTGRLKMPEADASPKTYTYHDSCYLGRWNGIFDAPRRIIKQIQGSTLVEMEASREKNLCCGGGGGRMFMEESTGERINVVRAKQALATEADVIAVACPYCLTMFADGIGELGSTAKVMDIAEILQEQLAK